MTREAALEVAASHVVDDAIRSQALVRMLPAVYCLPDLATDRRCQRRGALLYRPDAALGALDALDEWGVSLDTTPAGPLEMVTDEHHRASHVARVRVRRRRGFRNEAPQVVVRDGMRLVRLETAIIDSWGTLPAIEQRMPALVAVRERRTTGARLVAALDARDRVAGAAPMRRVFGLIGAGCHSQLELWGHERVFARPGLRHAMPQFRLVLGDRVVYLDRYYEAEMLAVEMDGAAYHGAPGQRERDIRRDASVATRGIQTIRFGHPRLFGDPDGVGDELLEVLEVRRRQLLR